MATIIRETYRHNIHYYLVLAGHQPLGVYADNGDNLWDPRTDRYLGPTSREPEFKGCKESAIIQNSSIVKQSIHPKEVAQHILNALKAAIRIAAEDGRIVRVGSGKKRYPTVEFEVLLKRGRLYFEKNVKWYPDLVFDFGASEEADLCRTAIAALTRKNVSKYVIAAVQDRLDALDVNERIKHEGAPIVR